MIIFIPGLGATEMIFRNLIPLLEKDFRCQVLRWVNPGDAISLEDYAELLKEQIEEPEVFALLGVSMGGMLAVELSRKIKVRHLILVSSAKTRAELPWDVRMFRRIPIQRWMPASLLKKVCVVGAFVFFFQRSRKENELIRTMIRSIPPELLKWSVNAIVCWDNKSCRKDVLHLHGTHDMILWRSYIRNAEIIKGGTHYMIIQKAGLIHQKMMEYFRRQER